MLQRTGLLLGEPVMTRLARTRVMVLGLGGVGSWCAESLVRTGIRHLTLVDSDRVCVTNINRQLMATVHTVGAVKADVLAARLREIHPAADITARREIYSAETAARFNLDSYDYVIDAIDSLRHKVDLIRAATRSRAVLFASMGASLKIDPTRVRVAEFWQVKGCPLGAVLRKVLRKGERPAKPFLCVYSDEVRENLGAGATGGTDRCLCPKRTTAQVGGDPLDDHEGCSAKARINGSVAHIPAIFGFTLAGLVIQSVAETCSAAIHQEDPCDPDRGIRVSAEAWQEAS